MGWEPIRDLSSVPSVILVSISSVVSKSDLSGLRTLIQISICFFDCLAREFGSMWFMSDYGLRRITSDWLMRDPSIGPWGRTCLALRTTYSCSPHLG